MLPRGETTEGVSRIAEPGDQPLWTATSNVPSSTATPAAQTACSNSRSYTSRAAPAASVASSSEGLGAVLLVGRDECRFGDFLDEQGVPADRPDDRARAVGVRARVLGIDADDTGDARRVVVVLLEVQRWQQRFGQRVTGGIAQFEFLGDGVDVGAVADDGPRSVTCTALYEM